MLMLCPLFPSTLGAFPVMLIKCFSFYLCQLVQVAAKSIKTWGCEGEAAVQWVAPLITVHMYGGESPENRHWSTSGMNSQGCINFKELSHFIPLQALASLTFEKKPFFQKGFPLWFKFELIFIAITQNPSSIFFSALHSCFFFCCCS